MLLGVDLGWYVTIPFVVIYIKRWDLAVRLVDFTYRRPLVASKKSQHLSASPSILQFLWLLTIRLGVLVYSSDIWL